MRLEKKKERELAKREGLAGRTIFQVVWFVISGVITFFGVRYLFANDTLTYNYFYLELGVPAWIPEWTIMAFLILVGIFLMNFFVITGYALFSPEARRRPGTPTTHTTNPDPFQDDYRR